MALCKYSFRNTNTIGCDSGIVKSAYKTGETDLMIIIIVITIKIFQLNRMPSTAPCGKTLPWNFAGIFHKYVMEFQTHLKALEFA